MFYEVCRINTEKVSVPFSSGVYYLIYSPNLSSKQLNHKVNKQNCYARVSIIKNVLIVLQNKTYFL